ncbi:hypothetical protein [Dactylosporangium sp. CA-233914]
MNRADGLEVHAEQSSPGGPPNASIGQATANAAGGAGYGLIIGW